MAFRARLIVGLATVTAAVALGAVSASAGTMSTLTFNPGGSTASPVPAGGTTTVTGTCPTNTWYVDVVFDLTLVGGGGQNVTARIDVDRTTGAFSGPIVIDATAGVQTVPASGTCWDNTSDPIVVGNLSGSVSVGPAVVATTSTTTTTTTTTTLPASATTAAPATTTTVVVGELPATGRNSNGAAALGASALALGIGLVLLARRRSAET